MQAPSPRDPLQPATANILNSRSSTPATSAATSKKRKRDDIGDGDLDTFTAKSIDPKAKTSTVIFVPRLLVPRSNIPLIWLAPASSYRTVSSPYLFEAVLPQTWQHDGCALIARLSPNGGLYAVERASSKSWVGCRLSSWVTEQHCRDAVTAKGKLLNQDAPVPSRPSHARSDSQSTTTSGRPMTPSSPKKPKNRRGALARMSILSTRDSDDLSPAFTESPALAESPQVMDAMSGDTPTISQSQIAALEPLPPSEEFVEGTLNTADIVQVGSDPLVLSVEAPVIDESRSDHLSFEHIIQQYLNTLYLSRTSLAFYAKGPLGRARAQAREGDGGFTTRDLADVYRLCIIPAKKCDLKYKDSLSCAIKELVTTGPLEEAANHPKKRAPKKVKLGKDGLYNIERDMVERWWRAREIENATTPGLDGAEAEMRRVLVDLRTRETQMQLLLILEVLYLESIVEKETQNNAEAAEIAVKIETGDEAPSTTLANTPKTKRNPRNFQSELDALADKLSIWHTISLDDLLSSPNKIRGEDEPSPKSKDRLKDFCTDVIKPFYGAKLAEQTKLLCRKLGGVDISPQRHRPTASKSNSQAKKSESANQRPRSATFKRPLDRVLSEDKSLRQASPPVLSRSATMPNSRHEKPRLGLKREPSDASTRPASRAGIQKSVSFMGREIDLVADAKIHEAKKQKLDKMNIQQEELRAAIEALKKPNRGNIAKEIMDEAEQRKTIQITATPGRRKAAQVLKAGYNLIGLEDHETRLEELHPIIPSSTMKPALTPNIARVSTRKRAVLASINDTPSRGFGRISDPLELSKFAPMKDGVAATPAANRLRPDLPPHSFETPLPKMKKSGRTVLFTPMKRAEIDVQDVFKDAPVIPIEAGKAMDRVMGGKGTGEEISLDADVSIYDHLGWNDDT